MAVGETAPRGGDRFIVDSSDSEWQMNLTSLAKGELLLSRATYRQPVKILFPLPACFQPEG
jgi:hypothetical protein